jgi:hypothetical protein
MKDERLSKLIEKVANALRNAKLTPFGIEKTVKEMKKIAKIITGVFIVAVLLSLLLYDTVTHDGFYELGKITASLLGIVDFFCFVVVITGFVIIWESWREIRRSKNG